MPKLPEVMKGLIYGGMGVTRFTQDSPVLLAVWASYGEELQQGGGKQIKNGEWPRIELLLTPYQKAGPTNLNPGSLSKVLGDRLDKNSEDMPRASKKKRPDASTWAVAYNQTAVVALLSFAELVRCVLPMTRWWGKRLQVTIKKWYDRCSPKLKRAIDSANRGPLNLANVIQISAVQDVVIEALDRNSKIEKSRHATRSAPVGSSKRTNGENTLAADALQLPVEALWLIRAVGTIGYAHQKAMSIIAEKSESKRADLWNEI